MLRRADGDGFVVTASQESEGIEALLAHEPELDASQVSLASHNDEDIKEEHTHEQEQRSSVCGPVTNHYEPIGAHAPGATTYLAPAAANFVFSRDDDLENLMAAHESIESRAHIETSAAVRGSLPAFTSERACLP